MVTRVHVVARVEKISTRQCANVHVATRFRTERGAKSSRTAKLNAKA